MTYSPAWWAFVESLPSRGVSERHMAHVRARIAEFSAWAPEPHVEWDGESGVHFSWSTEKTYAVIAASDVDAFALHHDGTAHVRQWVTCRGPLPADFRAFVEAMHLPECLRGLAAQGVPAEIIAHARERIAELSANAPTPRVRWDAHDRQLVLTWRSSIDTARLGVCEDCAGVSFMCSAPLDGGHFGLTSAHRRGQPLPQDFITVASRARADVCEDEAWGVL